MIRRGAVPNGWILTVGVIATLPSWTMPPPASGQTSEAAQIVGTPSPDIVVEARSRDRLRAFVRNVTRPADGRQLARWNAPLCPRIDGFAATYASFIEARLRAVAADVGVRMDRPGCRATVLIRMTDRADELASALIRLSPPRFGSLTGEARLPDQQIRAITSPRTIRWLTATATVMSDGTPVVTAPRGATSVNDLLANANKIYSSSLVRSVTREDVASKIVIVDERRLRGITLRQLGDYLSFVTLASPDLTADFSQDDSIMSLLSGAPTPPHGLTQGDTALLKALYAIAPDRSPERQRGAIIHRLKQPDREAGQP